MTGSGASPESRTSGFPVFLDSGLAASRRPSMTAEAPVVANRGGIRALCMMRWGMPSSQKAQLDAAGRRADKLRAKGKARQFRESAPAMSSHLRAAAAK
jgi:hypothetical protein